MYRQEPDCLADKHGIYSGDITYLMVILRFYGFQGEWEKGPNYWRCKFSDGSWLVWWTNNNCLAIVGSYQDRICHSNELTALVDDIESEVTLFLQYEVTPQFEFGLASYEGGEDE